MPFKLLLWWLTILGMLSFYTYKYVCVCVNIYMKIYVGQGQKLRHCSLLTFENLTNNENYIFFSVPILAPLVVMISAALCGKNDMVNSDLMG